MAPAEIPPALRALADVGGALLRRSATGRVFLGRLAGLLAAEELPPALRDLDAVLQRARQQAAEPLAARTVEKLLRDAWGRPPGRVLDDISLDAPAAVTPLAQVHRAELDGEAIAVKVLRPKLDAPLRADLALLDALRPPLAALLPRADAGALVAQIRERALDELDLEHEAAQERALGRALRGTEGVEVPAVRSEFSAPAVKVAAWLEGPTLAERRPHDPAPTARALVTAHVAAARAGLVLTDARPNHVILRPGGGIGLLGAGGAVAGDRRRLAHQLAAAAALRQPDPAAFAAAAAAAGVLDGDGAARDGHAWLREVLGEFVAGPASLDARALGAVGERAFRRRADGLAVGGRVRAEPGDIWPARAIAQLVTVLAALGAREDWISLLA